MAAKLTGADAVSSPAPRRRVRVLFVDHETRLSGGERHLVDLIGALVAEDVEAHLAVPDEGPLADEARRAGATVHVLAMSASLRQLSRWRLADSPWVAARHSAALAGAAVRFARLCRAVRPDVVHSASQKAHVLAAPGARMLGIPHVWHVQDILEPGLLFRFMLLAARATAARVVAISDATAAPWRRGRLAARVRVAVEGVHQPAVDDAERAAMRRALGAGDGDVLVGIVGQIAHWKGQDLFVEAASILAPARPDLRFAVVGECLFAHNEAAFEAAVRATSAQRLPARLVWAGHLEPIEPVMAALDVVVHASRRPEPFGRVIVEAMAQGTPVVTGGLGAAPELVGDGGIVVPPDDARSLADAIDRLAADPALRHDLGEAARRRASAFTIDRAREQVVDVYDELLGRRGPATRLRAAFVTDATADVRSVTGLAERCDLTLVAPATLAGRVTTWPVPSSEVTTVVLRGGRSRFVLAAAWWLRRHRRAVDVVFVNDELTAAFGANLARRLGGPPVVLAIGRITEEYVACQRPAGPSWRHHVKLLVTRVLSRLNRRLADAAGTTGQRDAGVVARWNRRTRAIPAYGVDLDVFRPCGSREDARHRLGLPPGVPVVLYRSRVAPEKDPETFLLAVDRLRAEGRALTAVFQGGETDAFVEVSTRLGVETVLGSACPPAELPWWYRAADVVVQTSHAEALGISVLEAQACGTPVVASAVGGLPEAVGPGGYLVPPGDPAATAAAIARLLDDPQEAARLAERGAARVAAEYADDLAFDAWVALAAEVAGR